MIHKMRQCDFEAKKVYNNVLICSERTFEIDRQIAPDDLEQVDLRIEFDGEVYEMTSEQFEKALSLFKSVSKLSLTHLEELSESLRYHNKCDNEKSRD